MLCQQFSYLVLKLQRKCIITASSKIKDNNCLWNDEKINAGDKISSKDILEINLISKTSNITQAIIPEIQIS